MSHPTVCAVMLTCDRPELARRAVECFRAQTYDPVSRMLLIFDTGDLTWFNPASDAENEAQVGFGAAKGWTVGALRNEANSLTSRFDIILHWDSDDYSHPNRIAEQVALLQSSGADLVGYNEMLFWREPLGKNIYLDELCMDKGEAWLYRGDILGTSMCYWRKTWERVPFLAHGHDNEDIGFAKGVRAAGMKVVTVAATDNRPELRLPPAMIARIHAGNAKNPSYDPAQMRAHPLHWTRVTAWDDYCRSVME